MLTIYVVIAIIILCTWRYGFKKMRTLMLHKRTVKNADEIIVMSEGKIVERGRHDQLIELGGIYRKLYDMQSL